MCEHKNIEIDKIENEVICRDCGDYVDLKIKQEFKLKDEGDMLILERV